MRELERQRRCATLVQIELSRLEFETSPSVSTSKGILIVETRVVLSRRQFKNTNSSCSASGRTGPMWNRR